MCMSTSMYVCMLPRVCKMPQRPEKGTGSLGIEIQTFVSHCVSAGLLILGLLQEQVVLIPEAREMAQQLTFQVIELLNYLIDT